MALIWRGIDHNDLKVQFLADVTELFEKLPGDYYVTCGYRSARDSNILYDQYKNGIPEFVNGKVVLVNGKIKRTKKKGVRAAPGGKSAHNFGMAIDVVPDVDSVKPGLQMDWVTKHVMWQKLKLAILPHPRLTQGWRYGDWPHIEVYKWKDYVNWRGLYEDSLRELQEPERYLYEVA